ncbi:MAG: DUF3047 domain-containing protein [Acidobacteriota bacterium]
MHRALWLSLAVVALSSTDLIRLDSSSEGVGLPEGWTVRPVAKASTPMFSIRRDVDRKVLRVEGMKAAAWAQRELDRPIEPTAGSLDWSWRVLQLPQGADLRRADLDDAALRLYVVFGRPDRLMARGGRIIFYTWGNTEPEGLTQKSFVSDKIQIVRVAGAMEADGQWRDHRVQPFEDYRRFWNRQPPAITAVGLMQDTDMTGGKAISEIRSLTWHPAEAPVHTGASRPPR